MTRHLLLPFAPLLLSIPATAGVYAHYSFDTDYSDTSGNAHNGTLVDNGTVGNSGITSTAGDFKFGAGAMNFHADRDYIDLGATKAFGSGTPYTIAFWAKKAPGDTGDAATWDMVIGDRSQTGFFIALNDSSGAGLRWRSVDSTAARQADFTLTKDYLWHHYAIVGSGTTITLYVDGQLSGTPATGKQTGFQFNTIGEAYPTNDFDFNGQLDEVWIFDEALNAAAVSALFQSNDATAVPPYSGFHYRFDGDFNDSGTGANNATAAGNATITTEPALLVTGPGSLLLDGTDASLVSLPSAGTYTSAHPWSAAWWARRDAIGSNHGMVMGTAENTADFIWLNDSFTGLRFRSSDNINFDFTVAKDSDLHHYTLVADGAGSLSLYVDGQPSETLTGNTSFNVDSIGKAYPTTSLHYNFQGTLDEVHLMPQAMTDLQVATMYAQEHPAVDPAAVSKVRIVLLAGQSNADGRATIADLPAAFQVPQADVDFYYKVEGGSGTLTTLRPGLSETSQFGPEIVMGNRLADLYASEAGTRVAIIKYANGGTDLKTQWKAGGNATTTGDGPEYVTFQQTVTAGRAALAAKYPGATLELDSIVWMQGESDAVAASAGSYQTNLITFIADVRATYGSTLPFVIARLGSQQTALDSTYLNQVRAAQDAVALADPRTAIFSTDGFGMNGDGLHFNASGQQAMGSAFAEEAAYYDWMISTFSAADINAGLGEPDADQDKDGQSNRTEFLGASNPTSSDSRFTASVTRTGASTASILYPSSSSRFYAVEQWSEGSGLWETALPYAKGQEGQTTRAFNSSTAAGIYRVISKLP
ncbi:LamG-like jellyroll fold domain-containing protein [Haloferula sp. BvORR071]|uniref:sialate O-acetylesterase n=1 Tax=Haloferula sp. BvORR071 TaxID=1396141 RepID=UPI0005573788|nr:LamG-like jellyroll fold domain-containing protein [Haloferula sp. BvORR071]